MAASKKFVGDTDDLTERLIAASQQAFKPITGPLVERVLEPFDFSDAPATPPAARSPKAASSQPARNNNKGNTKSSGNSPAASRARSPAEAGRSSAAPKRGSVDLPRSALVAAVAAPKATFFSLGSRADLEAVLNSGGNPAGVRSCPAFFTSPRPEAMPMPSSVLLSRAGSVQVQA